MLPRTTVDEIIILSEAHSSGYTVHTKSNEYIYEISKKGYWWSDMKRDMVEIVEKCLVCQQNKVEY